MKRLSILHRVLLCAAFASAGIVGNVAAAESVDIPFTKTVLPNGLTLVVSEDHKAPVVAVSIWYHVGSADEPTGKTGFAHLFEHLMF
ncbi:MAG: insulinase family protein, partial [Dokdonella sp.]